MLDIIRKIMQLKESSQEKELSIEERNLVSVAYKNNVGTKRNSWRILETLERKEEMKKPSGNDAEKKRNLTIIRKFKKEVEQELVGLCNELINLITNILNNYKNDHSSKVFYHKLKADYHRYEGEIVQED